MQCQIWTLRMQDAANLVEKQQRNHKKHRAQGKSLIDFNGCSMVQ